MNKRMLYEIETRLYFTSEEDVYSNLPFIKENLKKTINFETIMYGRELFNKNKILRVSNVLEGDKTKVFLGYKEEDLGRLFNIRNEIDEEISDETNDSYILQILNYNKQKCSIKNINQILESYGHKQFMKLTGVNKSGYNDKYQINLKLMNCLDLKYPILLEIEKSASTLEEAYNQELELKNFIIKFHLEQRVVKEEPPYLLK